MRICFIIHVHQKLDWLDCYSGPSVLCFLERFDISVEESYCFTPLVASVCELLRQLLTSWKFRSFCIFFLYFTLLVIPLRKRKVLGSNPTVGKKFSFFYSFSTRVPYSSRWPLSVWNSGSIPRNACVACETKLCVTTKENDYWTGRKTDGRTDAVQSYPYVRLCFADKKTAA